MNKSATLVLSLTIAQSILVRADEIIQ